jgi:hypothetical protein
MRKFITIDDSKFPMVIAKYQKFMPTKEEFLDMQSTLSNYISAHSEFVLIVDLSDMPFLPAEFRIAQAKWQTSKNSEFVKQKMRLAFCTPSIIAQTMLKGVFILSKPSVPYTVESGVEKGIHWATNSQ